jgi:hypothetical protein
MKRAVSISLGSSTRDRAVEVTLLGERVRIERIGTDGDMEAAARAYQELDGRIDAFGVGGADLGLLVDTRWYPLHSTRAMVRFVEKTPIVDGTALKITLEQRVAPFLDSCIRDYIDRRGRTALIMTGADRWGLTRSFLDAGYACTFGDLIFSLGIPVPVHTERALKALAALLMPIAGRLPFRWVYPLGEKQEERKPRHPKYFRRATVVAGDCHYIKRYMPDDMRGKVVVTNTTTADDVALFRRCGVRYLVTTSPTIGDRSFGTNVIEAALIAAAAKGRVLTHAECAEALDRLGFGPELQELGPAEAA